MAVGKRQPEHQRVVSADRRSGVATAHSGRWQGQDESSGPGLDLETNSLSSSVFQKTVQGLTSYKLCQVWGFGPPSGGPAAGGLEVGGRHESDRNLPLHPGGAPHLHTRSTLTQDHRGMILHRGRSPMVNAYRLPNTIIHRNLPLHPGPRSQPRTCAHGVH